MKMFQLIIEKDIFFESTLLELKTFQNGLFKIVQGSGIHLNYSFDNRFVNQEGFIGEKEHFTFFNGVAYEYKGNYIKEDPLAIVHAELGRDIQNVVHIKGDFSGLTISSGKVNLFSCKTNSKPIFQYEDESLFIAASNVIEIVKILKERNITLPLNLDACYSLLSFDQMLKNDTLLKGIERIPPASICSLEMMGTVYETYFAFSNKSTNLSKEEYIEELDKAFRKAIFNEFERDKALGLSHLVTLSGGMDSRMVLSYAHDMGYADITAVCFSQSGHEEHRIAQKVAKQFNVPLIFHPLDGGAYLKDIDRTVAINGGTANYSGAAHSLEMFSTLDFAKYGILHTGQMGDGLLGTFLPEPYQIAPEYGRTIKKSAMSDKIRSYLDLQLNSFDNHELFQLYERGFNGVFNGYRVIEQFTPFASAFLDEDFMKLSLSIPAKMRFRRKIYIEWFNKYMPSMTKARIAGSNTRPLLRYTRPIFRLLPAFYKYKNLVLYKLNSRHVVSMNPFKKWFVENERLKIFMQTYYKENVHYLDGENELKKDCGLLFQQGYLGIFKVLTLLSALKQFKK